MNWKLFLKKVWWFVWEDDSVLSWIVNILLAFLIVKFLIYPGLGLVTGTDLPIVAVISGSMEHNGMDYDSWWLENGQWYEGEGIDKVMFSDYVMRNGFNTGDIIFLKGKEPKDINTGDIVVYETHLASYPIIHRVVDKQDGSFVMKGDNVGHTDPGLVTEDKIVGVAMFKVPYLGWLKIMFSKFIALFV